MQKKTRKSVSVDLNTWKELTQYKIDHNLRDLDSVIIKLLAETEED